MLANGIPNVIDLNDSGITIDMETGKISFPFFGLFKFFSEELKDSHDVTLVDGQIKVTEKLRLYGEAGRVFAKDLPFFAKATASFQAVRGIRSPEGFCKVLLKELEKKHKGLLTEDDIAMAQSVAEGDYVVVNR